jgi:ribosomal protein S12 methylthiotransferase accessory factor YcaO
VKIESFIPGKDASLESTIETMQKKLAARGFKLNESSLLHEVDGIRNCMLFTTRTARSMAKCWST